MQNRADILKKHAAELAELERKESISATLPMPPKLIVCHGSHCSVIYERSSIAELVGVLREFSGTFVPMAYARDGMFASVAPMRSREKNRREWVQDGPDYLCSVTVENGAGWEKFELSFWVEMAGQLLEINAQIGFRAMSLHRFHARNMKPAAKIHKEWRANDILHGAADRSIKWNTGGPETARYEYLFIDDLEHACEMLTSITEGA